MARLLASRPDLGRYPDLRTLARRCASTESVRMIWPRLDESARRYLTGLAAGFAGDDPLLDLGRPPGQVRTDCERLGLCWGDPPRVVRGVHGLLGDYPAGLAQADSDELSNTQVAEALTQVDETGRRILERMTWSSPLGRFGASSSQRLGRSPIERLVAAQLLVKIDSDRVLVPRNVTIALRGGRVFPPLPESPQDPHSTPRQVLEQALHDDNWVYLDWANEDGTTSTGIVRVLTISAGAAFLVRKAGPRVSVPLARLVNARLGPRVVIRGEPGRT